ncbi:zinc ABC transporter substrate-binding protein [uncultured Roseobacter sp.]|uniref:zinc ABC transporter substrate-binding protein n=1 Tax=uncultured Roseobacter sp. TaxID=114847 RepID=UPI00261BEB3D|nr:zinc ABC transporter substrate-binding protein [uncultured Roseobacter sp.]
MRAVFSILTVFPLSQPAVADTPRVVTDIAPIHSLVARVMEGVGTPDLILPPGASPHGYAMRPSEVRAISSADVIVWVGPALTPWLADTLDTLAPDAQQLELMEAAGVTHLPFRIGAMFDAHDDHDHDGHAEEANHDDHNDHNAHDDHDDHNGHDDHDKHDGHDTHEAHEAQDAHDDHDHAHGAEDPHIWLDPHNGQAILTAISNSLADADPQNADLYRDNAAAGVRELKEIEAKIKARLDPLQGRPFIVFHDAYHYFEARFGIEAIAAISLADGGAASAGHLAEVRDTVAATGARCALIEPEAREGLIDAVFAEADIRMETVYPLGLESDLGLTLYGQLLMQTSEAIARCLAD